MIDKLTEIDRKDLPLLKSLYAVKGWTNYVTYMTIDTYIRWFEQDPNVKNLKFFCLNGDFSRGTFVVTDRCSAFADTLSGSTEELLQLLLLIDYTKGYFFMSINERVATTLRTALKQKNVEVSVDVSNRMYTLPKEKAVEFDVQSPKEICLKPITKFSDYEKAYEVWPSRKISSVKLIERVAKYNPNVGAFLDDTMVSWVFRFPSGLLMALQTDEKYFGKGYGQLVVKAISKQVACDWGHDICAGIFDQNVASKSLFGKLGFKPAPEKVHWLSTRKTWTDQED